MDMSTVSNGTPGGNARVQATIRLRNDLCLQFRKPGLEPREYPSCRLQKGLIIASDSRELVEEGTGLGLSIVYGVTKNHGGTVQVSSHTGKGSSFILNFPSR